MNFWLIQRATMESRPTRKGVDSLLSFDYMGSAEFECGSLPKSLKRIRTNIANYSTSDLGISADKVLTVLCKPYEREGIEKFLRECCRGEERLKERSELAEWAHPETTRWKTRANCWWDIDNDWFAWERSPEFATALIANLQQAPK